MTEQLKNDTSKPKWNLITYVDPHSLPGHSIFEMLKTIGETLELKYISYVTSKAMAKLDKCLPYKSWKEKSFQANIYLLFERYRRI